MATIQPDGKTTSSPRLLEGGGWLQGTIKATYETLFALFGEPDTFPGCGETRWVVAIPAIRERATVYLTGSIDPRKNTDVALEWSIGGYVQNVVTAVDAAVHEQLASEV